MNWLADNALLIWVVGAVALTAALVIFFQTRSSGALAATAVVVALTAVLLVTEYLLETPREAVERTLYQLAATVEANDLPGALSYVAPSADPAVRAQIEREMPQVNIERARVRGTPKIEVASGSDPATATVECRGLIIAVVKHNGMKGGAEDEVTLQFVRHGDRWLIDSFTTKKNWNRALR